MTGRREELQVFKEKGQAVLRGEGNGAELRFEGCTGWGHEGGGPWQLESRQ